MMHKNKLLEQLIDLRTELRLTHFNKTGEQIIILSDAALFEVAQKRPLKQNEFNAISGLDEDFNKKYAQKFLSIIKSFNQSNLKSVKVSKQASKVLHHYKDRLTNMSKTNSNLYMGQIYQNHSFDLTLIENNLELKDYLTNNRIKNLKLNYKSDADERHITKLYREVNKTQIETGSYNLYIAYPYVEGIFSKDKFPIKAPLLYFPVKIERTLRTFTLKKIVKEMSFLIETYYLLHLKWRNHQWILLPLKSQILMKKYFMRLLSLFMKNMVYPLK